MKIQILTLFPEMFVGPFAASMVKRAVDKKLVEITIHNLRDWTEDKYQAVDDRPYGGGAGMIMRVDIIDRAVKSLRLLEPNSTVILLDAGGDQFNQLKAQKLAEEESVILICGHYEGVDHRVHEHIADATISVGPYVLSGGELAAMMVTDAIVRLIPGVLGNSASLNEESHNNGNIEYPQYTRPEVYQDWKVPKVLLEGNHKEITKWRNENAPASDSGLQPGLKSSQKESENQQ